MLAIDVKVNLKLTHVNTLTPN